MRKTLLIALLVVTMICTFTARANEPPQDAGWKIEDGVLTIFGEGAMKDYANVSEIPWYAQKDKITKIVVNEGITRIGNLAFYGLTNATEAILPQSLKETGISAFSYTEGTKTSIGNPLSDFLFDIDEIEVTKKTSTTVNRPAATTVSIPHDILGYLTIDSIGIKKYPVKDGADLETIQTAIGHFAETPLWDGNVGFCAHNRDYKYDFRNLKNIEKGDKVVYETRFGTRSYVVSEIKAIEETDWDDLLEVDDVNKVTMITCIEDQPTKRQMVQATQR